LGVEALRCGNRGAIRESKQPGSLNQQRRRGAHTKHHHQKQHHCPADQGQDAAPLTYTDLHGAPPYRETIAVASAKIGTLGGEKARGSKALEINGASTPTRMVTTDPGARHETDEQKR
jgi:hypothetical protein